MFAKVETMKKECMELFKGNVIKGEIGIFEYHSYNEIFAMRDVTIEQAADEIIEILKHIDNVEYESDNIALTFRFPVTKDEIIETLILNEVDNLMQGTEQYNENDSRTYLYDRIYECVKFIRKNPFIEEMTITHEETFLCEEDFEIRIFNVNKYDFDIEVMSDIYNIDDMDKEWDAIWNEVYKVVVA